MTPIPLISKLVDALQGADITYCHWKSNSNLELVELGRTDLDLLVARQHVREFRQILAQNGFVAARRPHVEDPPAVEHLFGYDSPADRFVHVHAHYQLILGHDRSKNYRLPIEKPYLASATSRGTFPIPSPEFEYVVLVIRMVLKYAIGDEILWEALRGRRAGPSSSERRELEDLRIAIDRDQVKAIVEEHLPYIGSPLFEKAENLFAGGSIRERLGVSRRMESALAPYARVPANVDTGLRIWRRLALASRRRTRSIHGFRLDSGGALIAIMGGDGAGKSTALNEITRWLSDEFDVSAIHLGKPPWSWTTRLIRGGLEAAHRLGLLAQDATTDAAVDPDLPAGADRRRLVWYACKARDRYKEYRKAQRAANRGVIILSDRFPHPALHGFDVPQIARLIGGGGSRLTRRLSQIEQRYHSMIALPDLSFVLLLEPEEAARRKTDEAHDYVVKRATEIWETDWENHDVRVIDASQSPQTVANEIKLAIWETLA
jgi:thymidylate kinase